MAYTLKGSGWNLMGAAHYAIRLVIVTIVFIVKRIEQNLKSKIKLKFIFEK